MSEYSVTWVIDGVLKINAENEGEAEKLANEKIVEVLGKIEGFKALGPQAIRGSAELITN